MPLSDDDLILRVQKGSSRDFEILVNRYHKPLIRFMYHFIGGDIDEAESLAQDVFIRVYTRIDRYLPQNTFKSFLFTIARNTAINHLKKSRRSKPLSHFLNPNTESRHFTSSDTPETQWNRNSQLELVSRALSHLSLNQRLALVLKVYMQYSYQQIREVTEWSIPKIETLISRGRSNMKKFIETQETRRESVTMKEEKS